MCNCFTGCNVCKFFTSFSNFRMKNILYLNNAANINSKVAGTVGWQNMSDQTHHLVYYDWKRKHWTHTNTVGGVFGIRISWCKQHIILSVLFYCSSEKLFSCLSPTVPCVSYVKHSCCCLDAAGWDQKNMGTSRTNKNIPHSLHSVDLGGKWRQTEGATPK